MPLRLVVAHLVSTVFMVGVIWMVQLVHYPLLARVGVEEFTGYQAAHSTRITALVGVTVLVTVALSVPAHEQLGAGFDTTAHRTLVVTNWLRTAAWTGSGVLSTAVLVAAVGR